MISEATAKQNNEYVEVLEPSDLKLRSIVAGPTCLTRLLRDLLDMNLKPFILYVKSYVTHRSCLIDKHPGSLHERFNKQLVLESAKTYSRKQ